LGWVVVALVFLVFIGARLVTRIRDENQHQLDEYRHQQLVAAFSSISPLPNASLVDRVDQSTWVEARYKTSVPPSEIQAFYNRELQSHGWKFDEEHAVLAPKDLGRRESTYCRGELMSSVVYAGERTHYTWTYALKLASGQPGCKLAGAHPDPAARVREVSSRESVIAARRTIRGPRRARFCCGGAENRRASSESRYESC